MTDGEFSHQQPTDGDRAVLAIRDRLELRRAYGDHRFDWLLTQVHQRISERARQACLDA